MKLDPLRGSLKDPTGKEIYRIGEFINIEIESVDMESRRIEMKKHEKM